MTRNEFNEQLQELIALAYEDHLPIMDVWSVLSEHLKVAGLMLDFEILVNYKKGRDEKNPPTGPA